MRKLALISVMSLAACSSAPVDDEGEEVVETEMAEQAVSVTDTPGKAVWTKVWRWRTNTEPTFAADVAADESGAAFVLRAFAYGDSSSNRVVQSGDVTRYSATGSMVFRKSIGLSSVTPGTARIAARGGRIAVVAQQTTTYDGYRDKTVFTLLDTDGNIVAERAFAAQYTERQENGETVGTYGSVRPRGVAVARDGSTVIVGELSGDADFGTGMMRDQSLANVDAFIIKVGADGAVQLARRYEATRATAVAVDSDGEIYVGGNGSLSNPGADWVARVTKLSPSGAVLSATDFAATESAYITHLASSGAGRLAVGGNYLGRLDVGSRAIENKYTNKFGEPFVAKLDPAGAPVFVRGFSGHARRNIGGIAIDSYGQVIVTLNFSTNVELGTLTFTAADSDDVENLLVKFSATRGSARWIKRYAGVGAVINEVTATGLAVTSSDRIMMSGTFREDVDFGKGMITGSLAGNGFVTRFYQ